MANPTAKVMTFDVSKGADSTGAIRTFWMRFPGLRGASDQDAGGNDVIYYLENPYYRDLVILRAIAVITTEDAQDGDIDVGLEDDSSGTDSVSTGNVIIDSLVNTAAGIFECLVPAALASTAQRYIWKKKGTTTQAYLTITQNGDVDASSLRWNLLLEVAPYEDMLNADVELGAIAVA